MHWWTSAPDILAGRDLQAGGTWLGVNRAGRFAAITNFRDAVPTKGRLESRGGLVRQYLETDTPTLPFLDEIDGQRFAGFNLLADDGKELAYASNRNGGTGILPPGIYGLANATLDTPWPKVARSKARLGALIGRNEVNVTQLFRLLADTEPASAAEVDLQGQAFARAHALSAPFIVLPDYGTRCSTVLIRDRNGRVSVSERRFGVDGRNSGQSDFGFQSDLQDRP